MKRNRWEALRSTEGHLGSLRGPENELFLCLTSEIAIEHGNGLNDTFKTSTIDLRARGTRNLRSPHQEKCQFAHFGIIRLLSPDKSRARNDFSIELERFTRQILLERDTQRYE